MARRRQVRRLRDRQGPLRWEFDTEDDARQMVKRLVQADGGQWREMNGAAATKPPT